MTGKLQAWLVALGMTMAGFTPSVCADEPAKINFEEHVKPIFREHCFSCHNMDMAKSDLALDNFSRMMQGGASGAVVEPGDPDASRLWLLVAHQDTPEMPPKQDKLADAKLEIIKAWIAGGALENAGSTAKIKKKPKFDLKGGGGSTRPDGPAILPEGLSRQPVVYSPRAAAITALAASPWAPLVAVAGQKQIVFYHSETFEQLGVLPFPEGIPYVLKFSRNGSLLLAGGGRGGHSGKVVVFDVKTGQRVFEVGDELDVVLAADINEDHSLIALGGPGRVLRVFSTADGSVVYESRKHTDWLYAVEFSPDGVLLASADRSGGLFVWEADTGREYQNLRGHAGAVNDVSWRADGNLLASAGEDGKVFLWEMENGTAVKQWDAHGGGTSAVEYAHDGRLVTVGRDRTPKVWDGNGALQRAFDALPDVALEAVFTHDDARIVVGDWTGEIRVLQAAEGQMLATLAANPPTLAMVAEAAAQRAAAAQAAADQIAGEIAGVQSQVTAAAATAATAAAEAVSAAKRAEEAATALTAAQQALTDKQAAATKAAADAQAARVAAEAAAQAAAAATAAAPQAAAGSSS
ncbi:MAG: hypothetical protein K1X74_13855 [Pirellulales bacterium]|nr:hypothetical protein [Pirellulales bacterium]